MTITWRFYPEHSLVRIYDEVGYLGCVPATRYERVSPDVWRFYNGDSYLATLVAKQVGGMPIALATDCTKWFPTEPIR